MRIEPMAFAPYWTGTAQAGASAPSHAVAARQGDVRSLVPKPPMAWLARAGRVITAGASRRLRAAQP